MSPHFDDAAYGLTLTISKLLNSDVPVKLINCFTVTRWTAIPVESKETEAISLLRAGEDQSYNALFDSKIDIVNLDLLDAPLRNNYIFRFKALAEDELALAEDLRGKLIREVEGVLLCPLSIGDHVDHVICLEAVLKLYAQLDIAFYEDLPYSARITEEQIVNHVEQVANRLQVSLIPLVNNMSNCSIDKSTAVRVYQSQMNEDIHSEILAHMENLQGERIWGEEKVLEKLKFSLGC
nr:PIG-L family deacetylase [Pedobacter sp. SYSU D00823]